MDVNLEKKIARANEIIAKRTNQNWERVKMCAK